MTVEEFEATIGTGRAPDVAPALLALWYDGRGDWDLAHRTVQDLDGRDAAWVHAHLHRKEGDRSNAGYWYRRAGQPAASGAIEAEWRQIVAALLESQYPRT